jgi:hypothetical protein
MPPGLRIAARDRGEPPTLLECGFAACPDNPTQYEPLKRLR